MTPGTRHIQEPGDYASGSNDKAGVRWGSDLVNTEDRQTKTAMMGDAGEEENDE